MFTLVCQTCENTDLDKLLKECLLIEKVVADEPDALQRNSHSIANVDDLRRKLWRKKNQETSKKGGKVSIEL